MTIIGIEIWFRNNKYIEYVSLIYMYVYFLLALTLMLQITVENERKLRTNVAIYCALCKNNRNLSTCQSINTLLLRCFRR